MEIISVVPRGYCQGVVRAIQIARKTAQDNPDTPVYMLGMIVHNQFVVDACKAIGIRFVEEAGKTRSELLDRIDSGIVIFTAHGISDDVKEKAIRKGLKVVDASCLDVIKTHDLVKQHIQQDGDVLYIGKKGHPESEGTVSLSKRVHLITSCEDIQRLDGLKNVLIIVTDIDKSKRFYHDLFGLEVVLDNNETVILTEGLVLQQKKIWQDFLKKEVKQKK